MRILYEGKFRALMMAGKLMTSVIFVASLVALIGCERAPPKILDTAYHYSRMLHIKSEIIDSNGGYELAEELIDLNLGKALYARTVADVRTTWLIDVNQNSMHMYKPFTCNKFELTKLGSDGNHVPLPYLVPTIKPRIRMPNDKWMNLHGISALVHYFSETPGWRYSKAFNHSGMAAGHSWSLTDPSGFMTIKLFFADSLDVLGRVLQLNAIEIAGKLSKRTIRIKSIASYIRESDYVEFELPLIYGCRGHEILPDNMRPAFELVSNNQWTRHHFKIQARALGWSGPNVTVSEQNYVEFAVSDIRDGVNKKLFMLRHLNPQINLKTIIDQSAGTQVLSNLRGRKKCEFLRLNSSSSASSQQPLEVRFTNDLVMSMENIESLIYGVTPETFMTLEKRALERYAYFAQELPDMFGPGTLGRVLRRYDIDRYNQTRLHSFAIWVFKRQDDEQQIVSIQKMFEFKIEEEKALLHGPDRARAFDISQDCYINNGEMVYGRDYVRVSIHYVTDRIHEFLEVRDWLESSFQDRILVVTDMNYLRVPRLQFTFGEYSISLKMLVLDTLPPHLVYHQANSYTLTSANVDKRVNVASLEECSRLCKKFRCTAMTFPSDAASPGLCSLAMHQIGKLKPSEGSVTYTSDSSEHEQTMLSGLGLGEPDESIQNERTSRALEAFRNLRLTLRPMADFVSLKPARLRIETGAQE